MSAPKMPVLGEPAVTPGTVVVAETGGGLAQYLLDGRHRLVADEPVASGGTDLGPGPYELLLMSLGACTSMTLRIYANRKQLPLERVIVRLRHARDYARDCADCETNPVLLDRIDREIELVGPLGEDQRGRLLALANSCPVHRTLTASKIVVTTTLAAPA